MRMVSVITTLLCLTLSACGNDPYRGMYDAVNIRNESAKTPAERSVTATPSYNQYKKEREQTQ